MRKLKILFLAVSVGTIIFSCKKPATPTPTPTDPRNQITGAYNMSDTLTIFYSKATPNIPLNDTVDVRANVLTIKTDAASSGQIDFFETPIGDSTFSFKANNVTANSSSVAFILPQQTIIENGGTQTLVGNISGAQLYGKYFFANKQLVYQYSGVLIVVINGTTYSIPYTGVSNGHRQ